LGYGICWHWVTPFSHTRETAPTVPTEREDYLFISWFCYQQNVPMEQKTRILQPLKSWYPKIRISRKKHGQNKQFVFFASRK
jgi:hypothetical protein